MWLFALPVIYLIIAVVVGWLLRGKSLRARLLVTTVVSLALFWATTIAGASIGIVVYEFYNVRQGTAPADFCAHPVKVYRRCACWNKATMRITSARWSVCSSWSLARRLCS